jgi:hypothetical protein
MCLLLNQTAAVRFRTIDGLSIRFAESDGDDDHGSC